MIGPLRTQPITRHRRIAHTLAFATLGRNPQGLLAPQPLRSFALDMPTLLEQILVSSAITPPGTAPRELPQLHTQRRIITGAPARDCCASP